MYRRQTLTSDPFDLIGGEGRLKNHLREKAHGIIEPVGHARQRNRGRIPSGHDGEPDSDRLQRLGQLHSGPLLGASLQAVPRQNGEAGPSAIEQSLSGVQDQHGRDEG